MSNKSVLGSPSVGVNPSRTSFPVSQSFTFTAAPGMLLPAYKKFLNIGDRISGVPSFFMRTEPMLAPSMTDIDCHLDIFFVPMRHMVGMFENWYTQVSDANSDLWTESSWTAQLPVLNGTNGPFGWVTQSIFNMSYQGQGQETFGFGMHRLVNMMGDNAQGIFTNLTHLDYSYQADQPKFDGIADRFWPIVGNNKSMAFCPYFYMAYQKIYMDVYRDTEFETNVVQSYNIDSLFNSGATTFHPNYPTDKRWQMFHLRYRNRNKDYFTSVHVNPVFNANGFLNNALSNLSAVKNWLDGSATYGVTPDGNSVQWTDVLDSTSSPLSFNGTTGNDKGRWLLNSGNAMVVGHDVTTTSNKNLFDSTDNSQLYHDHPVSISASTQSLTNMTNISAMRVGFALDKLLRAQNRAGRHADDQLYALFGVKLPQGISNEVYHVKSYQTMVHLGEVVSTAQTEMSNGQITPIGEMAGRGVALLNSKERFSFTAPCHGVFMALFSVAPRYRYIGAVEKENYKVGLHDFFRIQTDNLGQQPLFDYEYGDTVAPTRSAWQYYLMEDKIKFDKSSLAFTTNGNDPWTFSTVAPEYTMGFGFKVHPDDLNSLFVAQYDVKSGVWPDGNNNAPFYPQFPRVYLRDPFKVDFSMKCSLQSTMSRFGEPELGGL